MSSICSQTGYTVLVSVNLSPFPSLLDAQAFNTNVVFFNLLPNSCPWLLCRLTSFCLKSHMNVGKCSRIVAAVHYWGHQEFLSLVKSRMKKLKEKEWVCCSVTNKKRLCSWEWIFHGYMEAEGLWMLCPPLALPDPAHAPDSMRLCLFPLHRVPALMLQSVILQLSWYTFNSKKKALEKSFHSSVSVLCAGKCYYFW